MTYHAKSGEVAHTKSETNEVVDSLDIGSVEPGDEKTFEHFLSVPEVPTTVVDGDAVDIKYKLKVEVRLLITLKIFMNLDQTWVSPQLKKSWNLFL